MLVALIGTGPSAWAALQILKRKDVEILIFDAMPETFSQSSIDAAKDTIKSQKPHVHFDFPHGPRIRQTVTSIPTTFAFGGLSLIWGATVLPFSEKDCGDWGPIFQKIQPYYATILSSLPLSGDPDTSFRIPYEFPNLDLVRKQISHKFLSKKAIRLEESLRTCSGDDFFVMNSCLALYQRTEVSDGCFYCGKCLGGCPKEYIWSTESSIKAEINSSRANHLKGQRVIRLRCESNLINVESISAEGKEQTTQVDKVFLATGPVETFRILATSNMVDACGTLLDSQIFYGVALPLRKLANYESSLIGLSQLSFRIIKDDDKATFFQFYDYSDEMLALISKGSLLFRIVPTFLIRAILKRSFIYIGYLDSAESNKISLDLQSDGDISISLKESRNLVSKNVSLSIKALRKHLKAAGILVSPHLMRVGLPGAGVHIGSSLAHGKITHDDGSTSACRNVHVIDSSVLPSIKAGPITLTIMANAARIVDLVL